MNECELRVEYEPINAELTAELTKVQVEVDKVLNLNNQLKKELVDACLAESLYVKDGDNEPANADQPIVEEPVAKSINEAVVDNLNIDETFESAVELLASLSHQLPPLAQKTQRYAAFMNDELSDEKFSRHLQRLQQQVAISGAYSAHGNDFELALCQKLNDSYAAAISSAETVSTFRN
jgi:hypothetical protein